MVTVTEPDCVMEPEAVTVRSSALTVPSSIAEASLIVTVEALRLTAPPKSL